MSKSSCRTTGQSLALLSILICASSLARTQTMTAEQRLLRSMKSANQAAVFAALDELAHKAIGNAGAAPALVPDSPSQTEEREGPRPKIVTIDYPGAPLTLLVAINDGGEIIGYYVNNSGGVSSFLREPDGTYVAIDPPGAGAGPGFGTIIWSINNRGSVSGTFVDQVGAAHAYLRTHDGKYTQIDVEGAGPLCCTLGLNINEEDAIAGEYVDSANLYHGYLRLIDGKVEEFSVAGAGGTGFQKGTFTANVDGLNWNGDVAGGYFDNANVEHGLLRFRDGRITLFDIHGAGTGSGQGTNTAGINDRLAIPGNYIDQNNVNHGFVRFVNGYTEKFDVKTAGTSSGQGTIPENINCQGDITGNYFDSTGASYGFLRDADGRVTTFEIPSVTQLFPTNNNRTNAIVGYYEDANQILHGFLRTP
jgi:hypothetical protein